MASDLKIGSPEAKVVLARAQTIIERLTVAGARAQETKQAAINAFSAVQAEHIKDQLDELDIEQIKTVTEGRISLKPIKAAGYRTIGDLYEISVFSLERIRGVGSTTAIKVKAAVDQLSQTICQHTEVRIDANKQSASQTALLEFVRRQEHIGRVLSNEVTPFSVLLKLRELQTRSELAGAGSVRRFFARVFYSKARLEETTASLRELAELLDSDHVTSKLQIAERLDKPLDGRPVWIDFRARPADFFALLRELGVKEADSAAAAGRLPEHIVEAVQQQRLEESLLSVNLRGYQSFGARYALVQRRVLLGDEMGLGKTVQAIAAIAHQAANEAQGFVVICPAAVVANWASEIRHKSLLVPLIIHGTKAGRRRAFRKWMKDGGVGIMSYETVRILYEDIGFESLDLNFAVVDEAHYVKNVTAGRSKAVTAIVNQSERVLFLSGTPMENRLEEFYSLVSYLQPEIANSASLAIRASAVISPLTFRTQVAPVYLRRNQEDVLSELPERIHSDEWLTIGENELEAYRREVMAGNFMGMRRAVVIGDGCASTAKLDRLEAIIEEASDDGCKVLVFSFFRDVIDVVCARLPNVIGRIDGSVPPLQRQLIIDKFSEAPTPAVLVAQIQAGGTGLNIQAASVVILMEPQIKPSLEEQAIARSHRMGQTRRVQVFRLLASESVDERMVELLATKSQEFNDYARESSVKEAAPAAMDVSDTALAKEVIRLEQQRLTKSPLLQADDSSAR